MSRGDETEDSPPESALQAFFAPPLINVRTGGRQHRPGGRRHRPCASQHRPRALFRSLAPL